ncbi:hypothetical protein RIR_jg11528.t1 [Rhizophagus irregularis DAOM 181602=DAOM 197198]|nr:hypothetical protein RIR_jg11528.t1 [Rhizophagus irregularis DAOM 181602=DAOM 197198]
MGQSAESVTYDLFWRYPGSQMISIDQPIVDPMKMIKSGINLDNSPNVDQSSKMEIVTDTPVMKQIENTPFCKQFLNHRIS